MGEAEEDRVGMIHALATLPTHPESVPINGLVRVAGTRLGDSAPLDPIDFVRAIAVARITMPRAMVRLSAGRGELSDEAQALCFLAGANSIFYGDKLLTTPNPKKAATTDCSPSSASPPWREPARRGMLHLISPLFGVMGGLFRTGASALAKRPV